MLHLTIDGKPLEVTEGCTILDAAKQAGIEIPTLCHADGIEPFTSCMMCVVLDTARNRMLPACSVKVEEGMDLDTSSDEVSQARKHTLELLLSEHVGNCEGPCRMACPARADIPRMLTRIQQGDPLGAAKIIRRDLVLPSIVERLCPAPCEMTCRRKAYDQEAVSIRRLGQFAADTELAGGVELPACADRNGKTVAVIGAGPAGLATAYHLARQGYACTVFDDRDQPGGTLCELVAIGKLPGDILDAELSIFHKLGIAFRMNTRIGRDIPFKKLCDDYNAVALTVGKIVPEVVAPFGIALARYGIAVQPGVLQTSVPKVFAGGDAVRAMRLAAHAVRDGQIIAHAIDQFLDGQPVIGKPVRFNSSIGNLHPGEVEEFMKEVDPAPRRDPAGDFMPGASRQAAARCLHCECLKPDTCKLRDYAEDFGAAPHRFRHRMRHLYEKVLQHEEVIFEPGKCIRCGICIRIVEAAGVKPGLGFQDRGLDVRVAVPFNRPLSEGLGHIARECVEACPTAALAFRQGKIAVKARRSRD